MTRPTRFWVAAALVSALGGFGCGSQPNHGSGDFISDVYGQSTGDRGGADAGAAAPPSDPGTDEGADPGRVIAEADIIQVDGDRLFALSAFAGLSVIDLSDPNDLRVLGNHRFSAQPFEMYLRDGVAYVMYNGYWSYEVDEATGSASWQSTARMQALDVADPADIEVLADEELHGQISDSRMVGDVIYLVTYENGYCWRCDTQPKTRVASFAVSPSGFSVIDQVELVSGEDWGPQSISVTTERIYVGSNDWDAWWSPEDTSEGNRIFTIDISSPTGELEIGATVAVHGRIESRWQMDEHEGVLRVISQAGGWGSGQEPVLETFTVTSSNEITPLASLTMRLPRPESLRSVRFDGDRAYAITFEQIDPLFTFDLSDPAVPLQVGELEIPGWVYHMEPRGDRVYGLGFDEGAMTVSIFDVSDLATPTMLDRVHFGGEWSWAVEDQDRIHKAFNLMLDRGLILVPFAGSGPADEGCRWEYQSGVQIVGVAGDDLTLRGVAPQIGTARRSILRGDVLFGVSDHAVQSFDVSNLDAPTALDTLELARHVTSVHAISDDEVLRFGNDWWTQRTTLDVANAEDASTAEPKTHLDLTDVAGESDTCDSYESWGHTVYPHGDYVYVPHYRYDYRSGRNEQGLRLYVVDMRGAQPEVVGHVEVDPARTGADVDYEYFGEILKTESALVVSRVRGSYWYDPESGSSGEQRVRYDVYSLEDPASPTFATRYELPADVARGGWGYFPWGCAIDYGYGWWYGGRASGGIVSGDVIASQHAELVRDGSGRVRYYLDRLDLRDPSAPRMLPPVNIPGQVVHYDHRGELVVTLEDVLQDERERSDWESCRASSGRVSFDWSEEVCRTWDRRINTLRLSDEGARLVSRESLDRDGFYGTSVAVTASRVFVRSQEGGLYGWDSPEVPEARVSVFALRDDGSLDVRPSAPLESGSGFYWWGGLTARGEHAFITESNRLVVIDASGRGEPEVRDVDMPGWSCQSLEVRNGRAFCAMGPYGVLTVDL